jgi:RNA polymerase sigma-32 factor
MEARMGRQDLSLDQPLRSRHGESRIDNLASAERGPEARLEKRQLRDIVKRIISRFARQLSRREADILSSRICSVAPLTLEKLGKRYGVSRERVRQIETNILPKMRIYIRMKCPECEAFLA